MGLQIEVTGDEVKLSGSLSCSAGGGIPRPAAASRAGTSGLPGARNRGVLP